MKKNILFIIAIGLACTAVSQSQTKAELDLLTDFNKKVHFKRQQAKNFQLGFATARKTEFSNQEVIRQSALELDVQTVIIRYPAEIGGTSIGYLRRRGQGESQVTLAVDIGAMNNEAKFENRDRVRQERKEKARELRRINRGRPRN